MSELPPPRPPRRPLAKRLGDLRMWASRRSGRSFAPPDWLSVNVTLRCNLACTMCTTCYDAPELTTGEIKDLVDQAAEMGVEVFNPLGGEPFVRNDLEDILAHAARRDLFTTLTTNATLIGAPRAARIARVPPQKLHINVSIDGLGEDHDVVRGRGTFARAIAGYRALRAADDAAGNPLRTIRANVILHRKNLDRFEELLAFLDAEGFSGVQVLNLFRDAKDPTVGGLWFDAASLPRLEALVERLADARRAGLRPAALLTARPDDLRLIPRYYREGLGPLEAPCWAGWKELYVNSDGTTIMCDGGLDFLAGRFGDTRTHTLRELWDSEALRERRRVVKACRTPCIQNCYLRRESDALAPIAQELVAEAVAPLRAAVARLRARPLRRLDGVLTLEGSDVPSRDHPRRSAFFRRDDAAATAVLADPGALRDLVVEGRLDFGRGFFGVPLARRVRDALDAAGLRFSRIDLGWRGDPLWHPELGALLEVLRPLGPVGLRTSRALLRADARGLFGPLGERLDGVEVWVDDAPDDWVRRGWVRKGRPERGSVAPVVSWDARLMANIEDERQSDVVGNLWEEDGALVLARLEGRYAGAATTSSRL